MYLCIQISLPLAMKQVVISEVDIVYKLSISLHY